MGKMKRDYSEVERKDAVEGYSGDVPKPGIYDAVLSTVGDHTTSDTATVWTFDLTEEPFAGWRGWVYTNGEAAAWKEVQILEALGIMKAGAESVDTTHEAILKKAGPVRVRIKNEVYNDEKRGKITTILAPKDGQAGGSKKAKKDKGDTPF